MKILLICLLLIFVFSQHLGRKRYRYAHHPSPTPVVPYPIPPSNHQQPDVDVQRDQEFPGFVIPQEVPNHPAPSTDKAPKFTSTDPPTWNETKEDRLTFDEFDVPEYGTVEPQPDFSNTTASNLTFGSGLNSNGLHLGDSAPQLRNTFNSSEPEWTIKFDFPGKKKINFSVV